MPLNTRTPLDADPAISPPSILTVSEAALTTTANIARLTTSDLGGFDLNHCGDIEIIR